MAIFYTVVCRVPTPRTDLFRECGRFVKHLIAAAWLVTGCTAVRDETEPPSSGRLFHLGYHSYAAGTASTVAQRAFDRGLTLTYKSRRVASANPAIEFADAPILSNCK